MHEKHLLTGYTSSPSAHRRCERAHLCGPEPDIGTLRQVRAHQTQLSALLSFLLNASDTHKFSSLIY